MNTKDKATEEEFLFKIDKNRGILYKVSRMYMDNRDDQEDLYQEIVLQLWKSYNKFQGNSQFSTWMYRVAVNTAITYFKKDKKVSNQLTSLSDKEGKLQVVEHDTAIDNQVDYLYKAIYQLNDVEKALIFLYLEGFSHQEIGTNLGIFGRKCSSKTEQNKN